MRKAQLIVIASLTLLSDDDDIELAIHFRVDNSKIPEVAEAMQDSTLGAIDLSDSKHGLTVSGDKACCRRTNVMVVDCLLCLDEMRAHVLAELNDAELVQTIIGIVDDAEGNGLSPSDLRVSETISFIEVRLSSMIFFFRPPFMIPPETS